MTRRHPTRPKDEAEAEPELRSVQSVVFGFRLIDALEAAAGRMSLKELAATAGIPPSRVHACLVRMGAVGLLAEDERGAVRSRSPGPVARPRRAHPPRRSQCSTPQDASPARPDGEAVHLSVSVGRAPVIASWLDEMREADRHARTHLQVRHAGHSMSASGGREQRPSASDINAVLPPSGRQQKS
jgi:DNA-binding IclR family transcriptional regulator